MKDSVQTDTYVNIDCRKWFYFPTETKSKTQRLYCFPHAGGTASFFRPWVEHLNGEIELCGICLPGRGSRKNEPLSASIVAMSYDIAEAIHKENCRVFSFFGHSMGATLAFEVICRLREYGATLPKHFFISARQAPQFPIKVREEVANMSDCQFKEKILTLNGIPQEISNTPELLDFYLPILKADFSAIDNWQYAAKSPFNVALTALCGDADPTTTKESMLKWRDHSTAEFYFHGFRGDHFYLQKHLEQVINLISRTLSFD